MLRELDERAQQRYVSSYDRAILQAALGKTDEAFACLDRACEERAHALAWVKVDPLLDRLLPDPRFADLLRHVGLAP